MGKILGGKGSVAIIGINPDVTAILVQVRAFEKTLHPSARNPDHREAA